MRPLRFVGLALVIGFLLADRSPAFGKGGHGGHGGHGHAAHRSHGHGGHGHHGHASHAHAHSAAHSAHHRRGNHAFVRNRGVHNRNHPRHHAAWNHHYAHHHHNWGHHYGWYHHNWGWGWGGWNWYGGGPSYVDAGYVGSNVTVQNPALAPSGTSGPVGFFSLVGTIRTIRGNAVSVASTDGDPITLQTTPDTKIVLNSKQATLADLQPDDRVKVRYDNDNQAMTLVALRS